MPKIIVITGTAAGMGQAAVGSLAAEGNPLRHWRTGWAAVPEQGRRGLRPRLAGRCLELEAIADSRGCRAILA